MNKNLIIVLVVVVLLLIGGYFFMSNNTSEDVVIEDSDSMMMEDNQPTTFEDNSMLEDDTSGSEETMGEEDSTVEGLAEIKMVGEDFSFDPDSFTVKAGQEVTVTLTSNDMEHDFVLEDLDVQTETIEEGETGSVTFTAPEEPGEYTYYCSVGDHRAMGMVGTMIVE